MISYLYKKNYSNFALNLVEDPKAKFSLAINSGNLEVAYKQCQLIKDQESYKLLGEEATRQGNHQLMEVALLNQKSFEKLSFLYMLTGNTKKLEKMMNIANKKGDVMSRFHNSIYLGDIQERIKILAEIGQSYMSAVVHNYSEMAVPLKQSIEESLPEIDFNFKSYCLIPPKPILPQSSLLTQNNWPQNVIQEEEILYLQTNKDQQEQNQEQFFNLRLIEQNEFDLEKQISQKSEKFDSIGYQDAWEVEDLDLPDDNPEEIIEQEQTYDDQNISKYLNSQYAGHQTAMGNFDKAFDILKKQIGVSNFEPLKETMVEILNSNKVYLSAGIFQDPIQVTLSKQPFVFVNLQSLQNRLLLSQKFVSEYKLQESQQIIQQIFYQIPFLLQLEKQQQEELTDLIKSCLDYLMTIKFELQKQSVNIQFKSSIQRQLELSAYMCCCQVDSNHKLLFLKNAMGFAYKNKCFIYSSYFAKKILNMFQVQPKDDTAQKAKKVFQACESQANNAFDILFEERMLYQPSLIGQISADNLKVISSKGKAIKLEIFKCPFCSASYDSNSLKQICQICNISQVGIKTFGLKSLL